jgi:uncharacterized protein (TIGR03083 family)
MDDGQVWQAIDVHRQRVVELLVSLSDVDWRQPSLCAGWTVRDVAAHLTLQQVGLREGMVGLIRARGNVERLIHDSACRRAAWPTEHIVAGIRGTIGSRRHNMGVTCRETLIDILVHGQDMAVPLGRPYEVAPDAAAEAATRVWHIPKRLDAFHVRDRLAGFRLTATDVPWTVGEGAEVSGPIDALLLVLAGRFAALPRLSGEGAPALTRALRP